MDQAKTGKFIKEMRKERGLTQRQLAEKLNISEKTVSKWETGNGLPDTGLMLPLCEALNITVNELLSAQERCCDGFVCCRNAFGHGADSRMRGICRYSDVAAHIFDNCRFFGDIFVHRAGVRAWREQRNIRMSPLRQKIFGFACGLYIRHAHDFEAQAEMPALRQNELVQKLLEKIGCNNYMPAAKFAAGI